MTPAEIRKLQRNRRRQPENIREAIKWANGAAFATPGKTPTADQVSRWARRWTAYFEEARDNGAPRADEPISERVLLSKLRMVIADLSTTAKPVSSAVSTEPLVVIGIEAWVADRFHGQLCEVWIGFEAGEEARAAKDPNAGKPSSLRRNRFPLMEAGLCRCRCESMVRAAGYPVPRKSACTFCPYGTKGDWQTLAAELPETFNQVAQLEADKPLTKNGKKLSIMGYRTLKDRDGNPTGEYRAPPLAKFIVGTYRPKTKPCSVCGAANRASKAMGCGYLPEAA